MLRSLFAFCTALLIALPAWGQKHYTDLDYPPLPDFTIPEAERVELDNGMILFLIEDHQLPLVSMSARIGGGGIQDPPDKVGLASLAGTVMRTGGSESMKGDEINERLENIAASVETSVGSSSGSAFMSTLQEHTDDVLAIFADVLMHPAFPEDKIALAKTQRRSSISRRNDDAQSIAFREFDELLYGSDHPLARSAEYATLDAVGRDDLVAFHGRYFKPNNVILGVWGDFDTNDMVGKLKGVFEDWAKDADFKRPAPPDIPSVVGYGVNLVPKEDVTQTSILLGHIGEITRDHPDYAAVTVMNQVLSGGFASRLFQNVRDDQGLAYAVFGSYSASYDRPGDFYAGVMTKSETTVEATRSVLHEIERMREAPPSADEILQAKDSYLNSFVFRFDTRREIVSRMMTYEYYGYPKDFLEQVKIGIEAVTAADVHRVAQRYLKSDQVQILAVGNSEDFGESLSVLGEVRQIDIAIPTGEEPAPEATTETREMGRSVLDGAIDALGGQAAFDGIRSARTKQDQSVTTPDNMEMSISTEIARLYPDDLLMIQRLPMGEMKIVKKGGEYVFPDTLPEQMHGPMSQEIEASLWRDLPFLFRYSDQVEVQLLPQEELDGRMVDVLQIAPPGGVESFKLYVDSETRMPAAVAYTSSAMGMGPPTPTRELYSDYREVSLGIQVPFRSTIFVGDQPGGSVTIQSMELNADVDESLFN